MLNEYQEFLDYTSSLELKVKSEKPNFISGEIYGRLLKDSITLRRGIERALTIISRRYLFHDLDDVNKLTPLNKENRKVRLDLAMGALKTWCSTESIKDTRYNSLVGKYGCGRFYDYMIDVKNAFHNILERINQGEIERTSAKIKDYQITLENTDKAIDFWKVTYLPKVLSKTFYSNESNLKSKYSNRIITFDTILAQAINQGPLKKRSVALSYDFFPFIVEYFNEKYKAYMFDFALTTALYVLDSSNSDNDYQIINTTYMANWLHKKNFDRSFKLFNQKLSDTDLFAEEIVFNVTKKIYIAEEITKFFIIIDEVNPPKEGYFIITDDIPLKVLNGEFKSLYNQSLQKKANP